MKIYRKAFPLPLEGIPIEYGESLVDNRLTKMESEQIAQRFNLVERVGGGMWGIAYRTIDDKILKITADMNEVFVARKIMENNKGPFAKVYDLGEIHNGLFYILKEKLTPISEKEKTAFRIVNESYWWDANDEKNPLLNPEYKWIEKSLFEEIMAYIVDAESYLFQDVINPNNVGRDSSGNLACFDARVDNL